LFCAVTSSPVELVNERNNMYELLQGLRIVEHASFIAAPSCGLYLRQLGAEVIRIDLIQGGPDQGRWPLSPEGSNFYWEGLNKGKKSIAIDMSCHEGRELAAQIITASGKYGGVFVTNSPPDGFLSHAQLTARRADLISVRVIGSIGLMATHSWLTRPAPGELVWSKVKEVAARLPGMMASKRSSHTMQTI